MQQQICLDDSQKYPALSKVFITTYNRSPGSSLATNIESFLKELAITDQKRCVTTAAAYARVIKEGYSSRTLSKDGSNTLLTTYHFNLSPLAEAFLDTKQQRRSH
jgi:hypothetical protein